MDLRSELLPPVLDEQLVGRLARLAADLDGAEPGLREEDLAEFNRPAGTVIPFREFQEIYEAENHADFVRRVLYKQLIKPAPDVTRAELAEVVRRAMPVNEFFDQHEAYMIIFDANVPMDGASVLIFYPPGYDERTDTWDGGQPVGEYNPTPEQIVKWAFESGPRKENA